MPHRLPLTVQLIAHYGKGLTNNTNCVKHAAGKSPIYRVASNEVDLEQLRDRTRAMRSWSDSLRTLEIYARLKRTVGKAPRASLHLVRERRLRTVSQFW
jgi:hypothetical protein